MHRRIRSKAMKAFLTPAGKWTGQIEKAADFPDVSQADAAVVQFQLQDVELYYMFGDDAASQYDFAVPLHWRQSPATKAG
jgi:hypothetical protein